jgi:NAD(P)-dependent dehydrogenase (short-subunit alcohol dehydrogenase family)
MKTAIITGAYGAIGKAIAGNIAMAGYRTCLVGRDPGKLQEAAGEIKSKTKNPEVFYEVVDLSSAGEIRAFAGNWKGPLSVMINNAATAPRRRILSAEGVEMQWAVNVLGYFRMISCFSNYMKNAEDARIVNVASYWAGGLDLADPEFTRRKYDNDAAYRQSKQADRMLTVAFAGRLRSQGITVNSCHPGDVNSKLSNDLGFGGHEQPDEGAATPVWLATSPEVTGRSGKYFADSRETWCEFSADHPKIEKLYELCQNYG